MKCITCQEKLDKYVVKATIQFQAEQERTQILDVSFTTYAEFDTELGAKTAISVLQKFMINAEIEEQTNEEK